MSVDDRTPVIVGVAQVEQREDDPAAAREPLELMLDAVHAAATDCGAPGILKAVDSIRVVRGMWGYGNPARALARQIGVPNAETGLTSLGGNYVQSLTNRSFLDIQSGRREVVVVTGAECGRTQARAKKAGLELNWDPLAAPPGASPVARETGDSPELYLGSDKVTRHEAELARGMQRPIQFYPLFEIALRHANGESVAAHRKRVSELWADFNRVAVNNPYAWIREPMSAEDIAQTSAANRAISYPYTKLMNSNNSVDQGAALILTSVGHARRHGIPEDRWVYPLGGTEAWDHITVSERDNLYSSPAIRIASARLFELTNTTVADLDLVDLYSCFPVAVQVAANEIGLAQDRPLTVTGGLTFAGGPLNNYVMHAVARTVELLRERSGGRALVTANGGLLTKHALCLYGSEPSQTPFVWADLQAEVDAGFRRQVVIDHDGAATLESYVVMYGPNGEPDVAHCACLTPDGKRTWANVTDYGTTCAMIDEEFCGRPVRIDGRGGLRVA